MHTFKRHLSTRHAQRGVAALAVTLMLFFAMTLTAAYANRGLWVEQRASANQYRAAQAFEAAEAGLEWATAQLNDPHRINARCQRSGSAGDASFRSRYLQVDSISGQHTALTWLRGGTAVALQAACVRRADGGGWACSCPVNGEPNVDSAALDAAAADATESAAVQPAFIVQFTDVAQAGLVRITSIGCASASGACRPGPADQDTDHVSRHTDATSTVHAVLGLLPGLSMAPRAALTAKGTVDAGTAALGVDNADAASGGVTVHAGGDLRGAALQLTTAPGGIASASAASHDRALAARSNDRLFATYFGVDKATWKNHAAMQTLRCTGDCAAAVAHAIEHTDSNHLVWLEGDAQFDGPATLGTPADPVVIVVSGRATLHGALRLHGVLYASEVLCDDAAGASGVPAQTHGAVVSESDFSAHAAAQVNYDAAVLRALQTQTGSFARVSGSWRDF